MITCTGVIKCLSMDVEWSGYAQVYVPYYSSVVVETTIVWVYMFDLIVPNTSG